MSNAIYCITPLPVIKHVSIWNQFLYSNIWNGFQLFNIFIYKCSFLDLQYPWLSPPPYEANLYPEKYEILCSNGLKPVNMFNMQMLSSWFTVRTKLLHFIKCQFYTEKLILHVHFQYQMQTRRRIKLLKNRSIKYSYFILFLTSYILKSYVSLFKKMQKISHGEILCFLKYCSQISHFYLNMKLLVFYEELRKSILLRTRFKSKHVPWYSWMQLQRILDFNEICATV